MLVHERAPNGNRLNQALSPGLLMMVMTMMMIIMMHDVK